MSLIERDVLDIEDTLRSRDYTTRARRRKFLREAAVAVLVVGLGALAMWGLR